eukprot:tig00000852_g5042.t1
MPPSVIETVQAMREARRAWQTQDGAGFSIGFVPTMGFLHAGHISLVQEAKRRCRRVVVSIFVNPKQFAPHEDLATYPRDLQRDLQLLDAEGGVDAVFHPSADELYPPGFSTYVKVENCSDLLEGDPSRGGRAGFFRGVATVVCKLFNVVQPTVALFGQKDAQQAIVIERMVRDLHMDLHVAVMPIVREPDGLALSSRNAYLTAPERASATVLYKSLQAAQSLYKNGERDSNQIRRAVETVLAGEPLAQVVYVSLANRETLAEIDGPLPASFLLSLAVRIGKARLIDNWNHSD